MVCSHAPEARQCHCCVLCHYSRLSRLSSCSSSICLVETISVVFPAFMLRRSIPAYRGVPHSLGPRCLVRAIAKTETATIARTCWGRLNSARRKLLEPKPWTTWVRLAPAISMRRISMRFLWVAFRPVGGRRYPGRLQRRGEVH